MHELAEEHLRAHLLAAIEARGTDAVIREVEGVAANTVRNFAAGKGAASRRTVAAVRAWFLARQAGRTEAPAPYRETGAGGAHARVAESSGAPFMSGAELRGRSIEVEALLAYTLERQRLITEALGQTGVLTPPATSEQLARAIAAQTTPDVLRGDDRARTGS